MDRRTVRQWRLERGLTQHQLAALVRVTHISVGNWENGRYEPSARQLEALAAALEVRMDQIAFHREDAKAALDSPDRT